ncbi:MAG: hypothetical protein A3G24_14220 [Betaproteobacteria bacterium RIFCSPLOWO2_12_FULL_62_13]|nr:MAG: hypothetical protein A3G24_14220 [Betaproteobacteria bacterium RIFCSPLOWO2_12_FULL_62_13]
MNLLAHHELAGFGGIGEGTNIQKTSDGRRILWLAHESAPKNFTAVDVTDPRNLKMVIQTDLPHQKMRSNSLDVVGDMLAVAYQTRGDRGTKPAGFDLFDISAPEQPKLISHFDCSGPHSLGVHCLWFVDGEYVHISSGAPDFQPRNPKDHQFYRIIDARNPSRPVEAGRWWYPGQREGDAEPPMPRHPRFDGGYRPHNMIVYPERPDRAYLGYIDGGIVILDISDKSRPREVSRLRYSPPYNGMTHTVMPLLSRGLLIVTDESNKDEAADWPKLAWVVDAREETNLVPIATLPLPPVEVFGKRGGRFGAHNLHENYPGPLSWRSDRIVVGAFFNAGVRAYDISNPYQPREIAYYVPGAPALSPKGAIQMNDVYIDDRGLVFAVDRFSGGLYVLEMTI